MNKLFSWFLQLIWYPFYNRIFQFQALSTSDHPLYSEVDCSCNTMSVSMQVVAPPTLSPSGKPLAPIISSNSPQNHKTHLLQAVRVKVPVAKVPTPMTPKAHILHSMGNVCYLKCSVVFIFMTYVFNQRNSINVIGVC